MRKYVIFANALKVWHTPEVAGGCMAFEYNQYSSAQFWYVGTAGEIAGLTGKDVKRATRDALQAGGLSRSQVAKEMAAWVDR